MAGLRRKASKATPKGASSITTKRLKTNSIDLAKQNDESVESEDDDYQQDHSSSDEEAEETVDAKRVRLARDYLQRLEAAPGEESSSEDDDDDEQHVMSVRDRVSMRLQRDRLKREGALERNVAQYVARDVAWMQQDILEKAAGDSTFTTEQNAKNWVDSGRVQLFRGHELTPTSVALQTTGERAISGSKDHSVILWDVELQKKIDYIVNPWKKGEQRGDGEALCVATSDDGRYAAVGRRDATVNIFDIRVSSTTGTSKNNLITSFHGHKGPVTCLAFRTQSNQLFSGSDDRCIRHYNLDEMTYVETLYGHQAGVSAIDCHKGERPISVGRDRTARGWKLAEDTHLIFRGGSKVSSADCITCVKDDWFVSGHDDGHLCLWLTDKKKAVKTIDNAHVDENMKGRGIVSVASLKGSDMVASGSNDGYLRLWNVSFSMLAWDKSLFFDPS